jgi:hypothetical protein
LELEATPQQSPFIYRIARAVLFVTNSYKRIKKFVQFSAFQRKQTFDEKNCYTLVLVCKERLSVLVVVLFVKLSVSASS